MTRARGLSPRLALKPAIISWAAISRAAIARAGIARAGIARAGILLVLLSGGAVAQSATDPSWLQEDSTIPGTLNDLPPASDGATPQGEPAPSAKTLAPAALDALAPVWFTPDAPAPMDSASAGASGATSAARSDTPSDTSPDLRFDGVDARGPFVIGPELEAPAPDPMVTCAAARRELALLAEAWPVYRDEQGRLRHQWARDPYRGARRYLDASARQAASAWATQTRDRDCPDAADPEAARAARATLLRAALCEAEQAELGALMALPAGTAAADTKTLTRKRSVVAEVCVTVQPSPLDAPTAPATMPVSGPVTAPGRDPSADAPAAVSSP